MRAFANQIATGLRQRGHVVNELTAPVCLGRLLPPAHPAAKWLGYLDQFLIFPPLLWLRAISLPPRSLCVLSDQALGPWFPWLGKRPHVVHCHDLLALESALGLQPFHRLTRSGCMYQRWIHRGFRRARCFLSVSTATQAALAPRLSTKPLLSSVLYNPLSPHFSVLPQEQAFRVIQSTLPQIAEESFLFHIGRTWYKNRMGVLAIWDHLHRLGCPRHLVLVGAIDPPMQEWLRQRQHLAPWLHVLESVSDDIVVALYNRAAVLLFPSHAEGFGWPVLEALACGCPVVTTNRAPMTEVGGQAVEYISPAPPPPEPMEDWALQAAHQVQKVLTRPPAQQERVRELGFVQASRFHQLPGWLDELEAHYQHALALQDRC